MNHDLVRPIQRAGMCLLIRGLVTATCHPVRAFACAPALCATRHFHNTLPPRISFFSCVFWAVSLFVVRLLPHGLEVLRRYTCVPLHALPAFAGGVMCLISLSYPVSVFWALDVSSSLGRSRSRGLNIRELASWFGVGCLTHVGV